jgi:transcriptional regulator with XRE-family HTH domain
VRGGVGTAASYSRLAERPPQCSMRLALCIVWFPSIGLGWVALLQVPIDNSIAGVSALSITPVGFFVTDGSQDQRPGLTHDRGSAYSQAVSAGNGTAYLGDGMATTKPDRVLLADALRRAIQESGLSYNELRRRAGVNQAQVSRFMLGERDLTLQVASRLCLCLGYELVRTGEPLTEPLDEPPPSSRTRPKGAPPPETAHARGRGRRVDLEAGEGTARPQQNRKARKRAGRG